MRSSVVFMATVAVALSGAWPQPSAAQTWNRDARGWVIVTVPAVPESCRNAAWPEEWERDFQKRANLVIRRTTRAGGFGSTWFENEKRSYGWAMLSVLGGEERAGLAFLQAEDPAAQTWNRETEGIDLFPAFTLKHQVRKYFFFGRALEPAYRERMRRAIAVFTERDPLHRPHHAFTGKREGWDPEAHNSWVDIRNTDNLRLMRDTAIYLFAEEAGNEQTRLAYRDHLQRFIVTMYRIGMGEWDSENYMGHTIAPLLNLHDFARDHEVRLLAKAGLDRAATMIALKYCRGAFAGPSKRDYNHPFPFGGSASMAGWLWFGDAPMEPPAFESDEIHAITSAYRPPRAVVELARKRFPRPVEILSGKPSYDAFEHPDQAEPTYRETTYFGRTFQFGTLLQGTQDPDVNGFKLVTWSSSRGGDVIAAAPIRDPLKICSPVYESGLLAPQSAVAQSRDSAIYLTREHDAPYHVLIPDDAEVRDTDGVTVVLLEKTSLAFWPINLTPFTPDAAATERVQWDTAKQGERMPRWPHARVLRGNRLASGWYGFAIQVDEGDREVFLRHVATIRPEVDEVAVRGAAVFQNRRGERFRLQWGDSPAAIKIWRNGRLRDWNDPAQNASWHTVDGDLITQAWQGDGSLAIRTNAERYRIQVNREGRVTFSESP